MVDFARTRATLSQLQKMEALSLEDALGLFCDLCEDISDEENPPLFTLPVHDSIRLMEVLAPSCRQVLNIFTIKAKEVGEIDPSGMLESFRNQLEVKSADLRKKEAQWRIDSKELKESRGELERQLTDYQTRVETLARERQEAEGILTKCEVLREEVRRLEEISLEDARKERSELDAKKRAVLQQIGALHDESDALQLQIEEEKKKQQKQIRENAARSTQLTELTRQLETMIQANAGIMDQDKTLREKLLQLQQKNGELEKRIRELQEVQIPERIARRDALRQTQQPLEEKKQALETEIAGQQQLLAVKTREVETLIAQGEALKAELRKAETEKAELQEAIRQLEELLDQIRENIGGLQERRNALEGETDRLQKENLPVAREALAKAEEAWQQTQEALEQLEDACKAIQDQITQGQAASGEKIRQKEVLSQRKAELDRQLAALVEDIHSLNQQIQDQEKKLASYQETKQKQQEKNENLEREITRLLDEELPTLSLRQSELTARKEKLAREIIQLQEEIKLLEKTIEENEQKKQGQIFVVEAQKKTNVELIKTQQGLTAQLEHLEEQQLTFIEGISAREAELAAKKKRYKQESRQREEALEQEKQALAEEKKRLDEGNEVLNSEVSQLRENLKALTSIQKKLDQLQVIHDTMIEDCGFLLTTKPDSAQDQIRDMCECLANGLFQARKSMDTYTKRFKEIQNLFSGGSNS